MKKTLFLLAGMLVATSVFAAADISFTLGQDTDSLSQPLVFAPDLAVPNTPQLGFLPETVTFEQSAAVILPTPIPIVTTPEPTTATLVLLSFAACGLRKFRQQHNA